MGQKFSDAARSTLLTDIDAESTNFLLASGGNLFPAANTGPLQPSQQHDWFKAVLQDSTGFEIVYVRTHPASSTAMSNVIRGQEGTTARAFLAGSIFAVRQTAADADFYANEKQNRTVVSVDLPLDPSPGDEWIDPSVPIKLTLFEDPEFPGEQDWIELGPHNVQMVGDITALPPAGAFNVIYVVQMADSSSIGYIWTGLAYQRVGNTGLKVLTGTTNASISGTTSVAHGLTLSKVVGLDAKVGSTTIYFPGNPTATLAYAVHMTATDAVVTNGPSAGAAILGQPFVLTVRYTP